MQYRELADTGMRVSEIGFGAWGIGGASAGATSYGNTDDAESCNALTAALDCGINFFDTANVYGEGRSEALIGKVFEHARDRVVIATKAGMERFDAPVDYSPAAIRRSLAESLRRLRTDHVDLLQLHNPDVDHLGAHPEIFDALNALKREGLIRAFGLSLKSPAEGLDAIASLGVKILQVNFNLLDMRALHCGLLDLAKQSGASVIARTPLCFGFLSGRVDRSTVFPPNDHRSRWSVRQIESWISGTEAVIGAVANERGDSPSQLALRFCLSYAAISTVIPGMLTVAEVDENAVSSDLGPLPERGLSAVEAVYRLIEPRLKP